MRTIRFQASLWLTVAAFALACHMPSNAQAQAGKAAPAGQYNLTKEILDHKDLNWKPAPNGIPGDVCGLLQVCTGTTKVIALPRATEGGQPVGRGVFLTQDQKHMDVLVIERQTPVDTYFFLLTPDGNLAKAAYAQVTSKSWLPMGSALAEPTFNKDKAVWHNWASKLSSGATAEKKPES